MHQNELWQEYYPNGEPIPGAGCNKNSDRAGKILGASQVWLYRNTPAEQELLFQLRAPEVYNGNLWDVSTAGHIDVGETRISAAVREANEEIGVKIAPDDLQFAFAFFRPNYGVKHFSYHTNVFLYNYTNSPADFRFNDAEVADLKWIPLSELDKFIKNGGVKPALASLDWYWQLLRDHLKQHEN